MGKRNENGCQFEALSHALLYLLGFSGTVIQNYFGSLGLLGKWQES